MTPERKGLYLYCLLQGQADSHPVGLGIDRTNEVFFLPYRDLQAAVSPVYLQEFGQDALEKNLQDLRWIGPRIRAHQEIIEKIMAFGPVIPIKFCTVFKNTERIEQILRIHYRRLTSFFTHIRGKEEWGLKLYLDEKRYGNVLGETSPAVQSWDERIAASSPGQAYFLRKKRNSFLREAAYRRSEEIAEEIFAALSSCAAESLKNRLFDSRSTGRIEEMILNAAFLLDHKKTQAFQKKVEALAEGHSRRGLLFEISGPWPPYNFCPALRGE